MTLEIKIVEQDPNTGAVLAKFRNDTSRRAIDDYPATAVATQGATTDEAMAYLALVGQDIADTQDAADLVADNTAFASYFLGKVGQTVRISSIDTAGVDASNAALTQRALTDAVQAHMDATARTYGYDDLKSAVTYADEPAVSKFQQEGQAFRAWRSLVWEHCYTVLADVQAGTRTIPTAAELIVELPPLNL